MARAVAAPTKIILLTISITQAVLSLGVGVASLYYVGKGTYALRDLLSNSQSIVLASTLVSGLLVLVAAATFGSKLLAERRALLGIRLRGAAAS